LALFGPSHRNSNLHFIRLLAVQRSQKYNRFSFSK
jgi:hypothetical protein